MKAKKAIHRILSGLLTGISVVALSGIAYGNSLVPDRIRSDSVGNYRVENPYAWQVDADVEASSQTTSPRTLTMLGVFPVKTVQFVSGEEKSVVICGTPFGCVVNVQNVLVVGFSDVRTQNGLENPAKTAGLRSDDVIVSVNGADIHSIQDLSAAVSRSNGTPLELVYRRSGIEKTTQLTPAYSEDEKTYKIGLWVRDSEAGVGILSFYDPESGVAVGLGHALKDSDTGKTFTSQGGTAYLAQILSVKKGSPGTPGQLSCCIQAGRAIGDILMNGDRGVYVSSDPISGKEVELASADQVSPGEATIYVSLDGKEPYEYTVQIEKVREDTADEKNLTVRVIDEDLIAQTGGIVQGMSGSPILQNGKLVGVVTHVLVDDPTCGYAIFAETLLATAENVDNASKVKEAS